jgi:hypothetical protein
VHPNEVQLEPPGAGLPALELAFAKLILFPMWCSQTSWEKSFKIFQEETEIILKLCESLSTDELCKRVLINRLPGIEDSSRNWSIAMTMEHLCIVNDRIAGVLVSLGAGVVPPGSVSTADVKPQGFLSAEEAVEKFRTSSESLISRASTEVQNRNSSATYKHPWFGQMNVRQWNSLTSLHQRLHRRQCQTIAESINPPEIVLRGRIAP